MECVQRSKKLCRYTSNYSRCWRSEFAERAQPCTRSNYDRSEEEIEWDEEKGLRHAWKATPDLCSCQLHFGIFKFVCLGLTLLLNIWGHITTVPACRSGTLTNVLPHRNAMPQTPDTTPHPVTVYRHGADLSLCSYPLMWNVTLEYTATHFNVLGETWLGNPSPTSHTQQRTLNLMLL